VLYHNTDPHRQLVRQHTDQLAHEMRRARRLTPEEAGYPGWERLASELLGRARSLFHRTGSHEPAYHV
jgi:hypothetical protein